jgi:hypothetical protein
MKYIATFSAQDNNPETMHHPQSSRIPISIRRHHQRPAA